MQLSANLQKIERGGEALMNSKTAAKGKQSEAKQIMTPSQLKRCHAIIHAAAGASAAGGVIPVPVADAIPISAAQITMVILLGKEFNQVIPESAAKAAISAAAATFAGRNLVKLIPIVGWGISAAVAASVTEAIGWTAAVDFARNAKKEMNQDKRKDKGGSEAASKNEAQSQNDDIVQLLQRADALLAKQVHDDDFKTEYKAVRFGLEKYIDDDTLPEFAALYERYEKLSELEL